MTVTGVVKHHDDLTLTITAEFDAPIDAVWQLWSNPRLLERWWGPPTHPATFVEHDLTPGSRVTYFMTGPEGERYHGWWRVTSVDAPTSFEVDDGFADEHGVPNPELPTTRMRVRLSARDGSGTHMTIESTFSSRDAMDQMMTMGAEEGMVLAMGQMDALVTHAG